MLARVHGAAVETRSLLLDADGVALDVDSDSLVVLNAGGEGFYRVAYPPEWRDRLLGAGVLDPLERFALVDDLWAAVLAGDTTAADFLACARGFADEDDLVVWRALNGYLRAEARLVVGDARAALLATIAEIVAPMLRRLGWGADGDARTRQRRGLAINLLGSVVGDPETIGRTREIDAAGTAGVDAEVAAASIAVVSSVGTVDDFERFLARARAAASPQEELRYLYTLADFPARSWCCARSSSRCRTRYAARTAPSWYSGRCVIVSMAPRPGRSYATAGTA